jgi:hypothetical protein
MGIKVENHAKTWRYRKVAMQKQGVTGG